MHIKFLVRSNHDRMILPVLKRYNYILPLRQQQQHHVTQWKRFFVAIKRPIQSQNYQKQPALDAVPVELTEDEPSIESTEDEVPSEPTDKMNNVDRAQHVLHQVKADTFVNSPVKTLEQTLVESQKEMRRAEPKEEKFARKAELNSAKQEYGYNVWKGQKYDIIDRTLERSQHRMMQLILQPYFKHYDFQREDSSDRDCLGLGHHFVHLNDQNFLLEKDLSDDGYDAAQSPGKEWSRRLWGGGSILSPNGKCLGLGSKICIQNKVKEIKVTENNGDEKMLVEFERNLYNMSDKHTLTNGGHVQPLLTENRTLVYMKQPFVPPRIVKSERLKLKTQADFWHSVTLTPVTLFRYSALTYNAHRVHYDIEYARQEGYEGLLVQGPLQVTFILEFLRLRLLRDKHEQDYLRQLDEKAANPYVRWKIESLEYKNIAPLYVGDRVKICNKLLKEELVENKTHRTYQLWIEGERFGELYMRGRARVIGSTYRYLLDNDYKDKLEALIRKINQIDTEAIDDENINADEAHITKLCSDLKAEYNNFRTCY